MKYKFHHFLTDSILTEEIKGCCGIYYWLQGVIEWVDEDGNRWKTNRLTVSDGFSVPRAFWGMMKNLVSRLAGYCHDEEYWLQDFSKDIADYNIFAGVLAQCEGLSRWHQFKITIIAGIIWAGLRLGGWVAWNKYTRELEEHGRDAVLGAHTAKTLSEAKHIAMHGYEFREEPHV